MCVSVMGGGITFSVTLDVVELFFLVTGIGPAPRITLLGTTTALPTLPTTFRADDEGLVETRGDARLTTGDVGVGVLLLLAAGALLLACVTDGRREEEGLEGEGEAAVGFVIVA